MKYIVLLAWAVSFAAVAEPSKESVCYKAVSGKDANVFKPLMWEVNIRRAINVEAKKCYGLKDNQACLAKLVEALKSCHDIGGSKFRMYVLEIERSAIAHLPAPLPGDKDTAVIPEQIGK